MKIGVVTSGGDCPGMNAFILELAKLCSKTDCDLIGYIGGYKGVEENNFIDLNFNSISGMSLGKRGGSILFTGRYENLKDDKKMIYLKQNLNKSGVDWLVVLGGDGSLRAAKKLSDLGIKVVGVPATIDNDVKGTDYTLGFDTAINKTLEVINDIEDTATAMPGKIYIVETLGGDSGNIAKAAFDQGAADIALIPEMPISDEELVNMVKEKFSNGNKYIIITICEGLKRTMHYSELLQQALNRKVHVTIIGHKQRGGSPTAYDRYMAKQFAKQAFDLIKKMIMGKWFAIHWVKLGIAIYNYF
ncbi:ATP-dependent 6-phosphofructokinase [Thermoanaerobacter siderophilus]|uniref:6-phosphofructokinase n=1 Tax=Thermoanaerobacter siderophilus SR4 TaxID=880478 RepID=I8QWH4_9THEO|nr:ATP-dependent 6-phosphofructokinase [Thermoanaerobacter siderophilus]EIV99302.1 6-phosphofructokinase [Thermoanaerobacter siderophilus SR4]